MSPAKYGQHFLINQNAQSQIVLWTLTPPTSSILEIGPGKGALTKLFLEKNVQVDAVEVDTAMVEYLKKTLSHNPYFILHHESILDFDFAAKIPVGRRPLRVVGNLPYNLTSPILRRLCDNPFWDYAVVMVQKEVGNRLCAKVNTADYGALTVGMQLSCEIEKGLVLSKGSFSPPPRVESMVVRLKRRDIPLTSDIPGTQKVIQAGFQQRRKTILNGLSHSFHLDKGAVYKILSTCHIDPMRRPETLTVSEFISLGEQLKFYNPALL